MEESRFFFDYFGSIKFMNFVSSGVRSETSNVVDAQDKFVKKLSWIQYYHKMKHMEPFTRGGIGHTDAKFSNLELLDSHSLTNMSGEVVTASQLDKLEVVKIVNDCFDGAEIEEKMWYFMVNGEVKIVSREQLLMKPTKELKCVHYFGKG